MPHPAAPAAMAQLAAPTSAGVPIAVGLLMLVLVPVPMSHSV
jgi:hypothetical protein